MNIHDNSKLQAGRKERRKQTIKWTVFSSIVFLFATQLLLILIPTVNPVEGFLFYGDVLTLGVPRNQSNLESLEVTIIKYHPINPLELEVDMEIVAPYPSDPENLWVLRIVSVDQENEIVVTSYDDTLLASLTSFEDVAGVYKGRANEFETVIYFSTIPWIYILNFLMSASILAAVYYYIFENKKRLNEKNI